MNDIDLIVLERYCSTEHSLFQVLIQRRKLLLLQTREKNGQQEIYLWDGGEPTTCLPIHSEDPFQFGLDEEGELIYRKDFWGTMQPETFYKADHTRVILNEALATQRLRQHLAQRKEEKPHEKFDPSS